MKPLSERDENQAGRKHIKDLLIPVGMKPLSERDENVYATLSLAVYTPQSRNEATL